MYLSVLDSFLCMDTNCPSGLLVTCTSIKVVIFLFDFELS